MATIIGAAVFASEGSGLGGRGTASIFIFVVSLVLIFLLGFAIRDALQKRGVRLRAAKDVARVPRRE